MLGLCGTTGGGAAPALEGIWAEFEEGGRAVCPPGQRSLLQDFPSLPKLNPERQRHVRLLWLFPSRQISEQPPGLPNWSGSQAWLLTAETDSGGGVSTGGGVGMEHRAAPPERTEIPSLFYILENAGRAAGAKRICSV